MTKEQEAIEMLEDIKNNTWTTKYIMSSDSKKAETVLNMLKEKDKEIEKKDKMIDKLSQIINYMLDDLDTKGFGKQEIYNSYKHRVEHSERYFQ